jgi:hypothetical protein
VGTVTLLLLSPIYPTNLFERLVGVINALKIVEFKTIPNISLKALNGAGIYSELDELANSNLG